MIGALFRFDNFPLVCKLIILKIKYLKIKNKEKNLKLATLLVTSRRDYSDRLVVRTPLTNILLKEFNKCLLKFFQICIIKMNLLNIKNNFLIF